MRVAHHLVLGLLAVALGGLSTSTTSNNSSSSTPSSTSSSSAASTAATTPTGPGDFGKSGWEEAYKNLSACARALGQNLTYVGQSLGVGFSGLGTGIWWGLRKGGVQAWEGLQIAWNKTMGVFGRRRRSAEFVHPQTALLGTGATLSHLHPFWLVSAFCYTIGLFFHLTVTLAICEVSSPRWSILWVVVIVILLPNTEAVSHTKHIGLVASAVVASSRCVSALNVISSRACEVGDNFLYFSNCCNYSDIYYCTRYLCWTAPGCAVCTEEGCWTSLGAGVSLWPRQSTARARTQAMEIFGVVGWAGEVLGALGLGEVYSFVLAGGVWYFVGQVPNLVCDVACAQGATDWFQEAAPTISTIWNFLTTIPKAFWSLIWHMPLVFGALLLWYLAAGRWVQALLLVFSVPGVLTASLPSPQTNIDEPCSYSIYSSTIVDTNNVTCLTPFGRYYFYNYNELTWLSDGFKCNENTTGHHGWKWVCAWGSWWWGAEDVDYPYSHPYLPPYPLTAICYVYQGELSSTEAFHLYYKRSSTPPFNATTIGTCLLDRRPPACDVCLRAHCFNATGRQDLDFDTCGGGWMYHPWEFLPLAFIRGPDRLQNRDHSKQFSWVPNTETAELLVASRYKHGVGCSASHGIINCWNCSQKLMQPKTNLSAWVLQPGKPVRLCINPQHARRHYQARNWLDTIQNAVNWWTGRGHCQWPDGHYPTCAGAAWYPTDGGFVTKVADMQVMGRSPETFTAFMSLYVALLVLMLSSGARFVPAVLALAGMLAYVGGECYAPCTPSYCSHYICWNPVPCVARVGGALYWPAANGFMTRPADLPDLGWHYAASVGVNWVSQVVGVPMFAFLGVLVPAMAPVTPSAHDTIYCGEAGDSPVTINGYDATWLAVALLVLLAPSWRWLGGCACGLLSGLRVLASYPYRLALVALQLATGSSAEFIVCLAILVQLWCFLYYPLAEAALSRAVVACPAAAWATRLDSWLEVCLGLLCAFLYGRVGGRLRFAAIAAYKVSTGLLGIALFLLLASDRGGRGALGYQVCVNIPEYEWSISDVWWYTSAAFSWAMVSLAFLSRQGRRMKMRLYARWCRFYCWLALMVRVSPIGRDGLGRHGTMLLWFIACLTWPREASLVMLVLLCALGVVDVIDWILEITLCVRPSTTGLVLLANSLHKTLTNKELSAFLERRWLAGEVMYRHAGQVAADLAERVSSLGGCLEPLTLHPEALSRVYDDTMTLTCGRWAGSKPVVARCGNVVLVGCAASVRSLPPGYELTAPLVVTRPPCGFFKTLKISLTGRGEVPASGQIALIGTANTSSMGCAVNGVFFTTFHATSGRALAGPHGGRNPFWSSASQDVVCYPLLPPMTSLEPCNCGDHSRWVVKPTGELIHGVGKEDYVVLDCPLPVSDIKGASGSPILCDKGHACGMLVGALARAGIASRVRFVVPWKIKPCDTVGSGIPDYPAVPTEGYKEVGYIAPTGSGKSTKFPAQLAKLGHRVLVLNPSVITTKAMQAYMKQLLGQSPNVYAGTGKGSVQLKSGSKITYCTYGRFLVSPEAFLGENDVVICDECHSTDGTSILGIGVVRTKAEKAGVRLVVFATATPPGSTVQSHSSITEEVLSGDGDIPFYGLALKSENYRVGRHVVFCHSKVECTRVAQEFISRGMPAVTYWRGTDPNVITDAPNLIVVATDALSTGYTGNFASVTDCCSVVSEECEVDLDPTFTVTVTVKPADAGLRMQRRGRTGRGAPGVYRPVIAGAPPSGVCSSAAAWAAVEAAYMWYGMREVAVSEALAAYQDCCYTSRLPNDPSEPVRALAVLKPLWHCEEVTREAVRETSWPLLTGVQKRVCLRDGAQAPSDDVRWAGITGEAACPLLYRIGRVTAPCASHPFAVKMAEALGDTSYRDTGVGPLLLAGAAVAAAVAVVGATGTLVIQSVWEVHGGGAPRHLGAHDILRNAEAQEGGPVPGAALEEVVTGLEWPTLQVVWGALDSGMTAVATGASKAGRSLCDWWYHGAPVVVQRVPTGGAAAHLVDILKTNISAVVAGGLAVVGARASPAFASLSALVAGIQTHAPAHVTWLITIVGGMAATLVGGTGPGVGVAAGFFLGTRFGSFSMLDVAVNAAAGYEACVTACAMTIDLLDGKCDTNNLLSCLVGLLSPGAAVAGVILGLLLKGLGSRDCTPWLNRLLTMLPRGHAVPDDFFKPREGLNLADTIRRMSLVGLVRRWCERSGDQDYILTGAGVLDRLANWVAGLLRFLADRCSLAVTSLLPVKVPYVNCQRGYTGTFGGEGCGTTICSCGVRLTVTVADGCWRVAGSRTCWNGLLGRFPINTSTTYSGTLRPEWEEVDTVRLAIGVRGSITLHRDRGAYWLHRTTCGHLTTGMIVSAAALGPLAINGENVSTFSNDHTGGDFGPGQWIHMDGVRVLLPHRIPRSIVFMNHPYQPSLFSDFGEDVTEAIVGPCEKAVECAEKMAEEAVEVAQATVETAGAMFSAAMEARRRAEMEAWKLREAALGGLDRDITQDDCEDLGLVNRHAYSMAEEEEENSADGTTSDDEPATLDVSCDDTPVPLGAEPMATGVAEAGTGDASDDVRNLVTDVQRVLGASVAVARSTGQRAVKAVCELVTAPIKKATSSRASAKRDMAHVELHDILKPMEWTASVAGEDREQARKDSKTVIRTLVHRCCGEDRSVTKCVGRRAPAALLWALFGTGNSGTWWDGDRELKDEDELGDTGRVLELVHETKCGKSYIWNGSPITTSEPRPAPDTRPVTAFLRADATRIYATNPEQVYSRIEKVTIDQVEAQLDGPYLDAYNLAKAKAGRLLEPGWSYDQAVAKVKPNSARGHVAKISVADLQTSKGRDAVMACLDDIRTGCLDAPFMLRPKVEVFPKTKSTYKPPRLIVYPSLEMRVAEKMILGDPARVAKAVMGEAYGFQYTPAERPEVLYKMWKSKKQPTAYTVDGTCFDSTVTPEDIAREGEIFAAANADPALVRRLHEVYATHPMMDPSGRVIGVRRCRASGTLTTSAGNSITCYLKVSAACRKACIPNPSFLIHGDDVVIIAEKTEDDRVGALKEALASYGYICEPQEHADLSSAETCSASMDVVKTARGSRRVLRTDMRRCLARVMGEYGNPLGTAWGYTLLYPTHPIVMYVLLPILLTIAMNNGLGCDQIVTLDVRGNLLNVPLRKMGAALRSLHGPDILAVTAHSATVLAESGEALAFFKMRGLGHWRRKRKLVAARLRRKGSDWAAVGNELLWSPGGARGPPIGPSDLDIPSDLWEHSWEGMEFQPVTQKRRLRLWPLVALLMMIFVI